MSAAERLELPLSVSSAAIGGLERLGEVAIPNDPECLHRRHESRGINGLGQIVIEARRDGALPILHMGVG